MDLVEIHLDTVDSTQNYAKQHCEDFARDKIICITAEEQTSGKGRFKRTWISPRGVNLYITFYFQLPSKALHLISIGQVLTSSFAIVLLKEGFHPKIKWPNDVQLNGKKISGILCEMRSRENFADVFLGIGINVNMAISDLAKIEQAATSLMVETGKPWDRQTLLKKLQVQFLSDLRKFQKEGFTPFHSEFENLLAYKGQTVRCFDGKKDWVGICHSLTNDGQLNLFLPSKEIHTVVSGEISGTTSKEG